MGRRTAEPCADKGFGPPHSVRWHLDLLFQADTLGFMKTIHVENVDSDFQGYVPHRAGDASRWLQLLGDLKYGKRRNHDQNKAPQHLLHATFRSVGICERIRAIRHSGMLSKKLIQ